MLRGSRQAVSVAGRALCGRGEGWFAELSRPAVPSTTRTVNITLGKNIEAGRILAGFTTSEPGHWTSWPPHEHAAILEELYVYYDMPAPAFGVQFVYTNPDEPEFVGVVRDGDAVIMPTWVSPERFCTRASDQLCLDDGRASRSRGSTVRRGHGTTRIRSRRQRP